MRTASKPGLTRGHLVERACRWLILAGTEWGPRWTFSNRVTRGPFLYFRFHPGVFV